MKETVNKNLLHGYLINSRIVPFVPLSASIPPLPPPFSPGSPYPAEKKIAHIPISITPRSPIRPNEHLAIPIRIAVFPIPRREIIPKREIIPVPSRLVSSRRPIKHKPLKGNS